MADTSLLFDLLGRDRLSKVFLQVRKSGQETAEALEKIGGDGTVRGRIDAIAAGVVHLGLSLAKIPAAVGALSAVGSTAAAVGASAAVLPAVGVATAVAMKTAQLGVQGFGDALSATDPAAFAEATGKLAPNARAAAVAARELAPAWRAVQQSVQQQLFDGVGKTIKMVGGTYMPILKTGLTDVASGFDNAVIGVRAFAMEAQTQRDVAAIFGTTSTAVGDVTAATRPALQIMRDLVAVGMEFLPGLTGGFGDAAQSAADFVAHARETGQLKEWISGGLSALGDLWTLLSNVAGIVSAVFGAFDTGGASFLQTAIAITGAVRDFLQSVEGQQALHALVDTLLTVSGVVTDVVLEALDQLAPLIVDLAPAVGALAGQVGGTLVVALRIAGPLLQMLAGFLAANIQWLGPLAIGLFGAVKAFEAVTVAMRLFNLIASVNPWVLLITATVALVALIVTYWDEIVAALAAAWEWIKSAASAAWDWVVGVVKGALDWLWNLFLNWSLPGLIIKHWDTIVAAARTAVQWVLDAVDWLKALPGRIGEWFGQAKDWAVRKLGELVDWVRGLPGRVLEAIGDIAGRMVEVGKDIIRGIVRGLGEAASWIWEKLRSIVSQAWNEVLDFFGIASPSKEGAWVGRMIGLGLAQGIDAMAGTVSGAAGRLSAAGMVTVSPPATAGAGGVAGFGPAAALAPGNGALVHIENYHPPADAPVDQVAADLHWRMLGAGRR